MIKAASCFTILSVADLRFVTSILLIGALKPAQFPAHVTVHKQQSPSKRQSTETKRHSTETKPVQEAMEQEDQAQKKEDIYSRYVSFDNNLIPHVKTIVNAFDFSIHQTAVDLGGTSFKT